MCWWNQVQMVNSHVMMFASVALCSLFTLLFHDWWQSAFYYQFLLFGNPSYWPKCYFLLGHWRICGRWCVFIIFSGFAWIYSFVPLTVARDVQESFFWYFGFCREGRPETVTEFYLPVFYLLGFDLWLAGIKMCFGIFLNNCRIIWIHQKHACTQSSNRLAACRSHAD